MLVAFSDEDESVRTEDELINKEPEDAGFDEVLDCVKLTDELDCGIFEEDEISSS